MSEFVVFVGTTQEKFEQSLVKAELLLEKAGATPVTDFTLEALTHKGGAAEKQYTAADLVDIAPNTGHKFFRAVPKGGGRA